MKTWDLRIVGWILGAWICTTLHAEQATSTVSPKVNASPLRSSLTLLIRADAEKLRSNTQTDAEFFSASADDVVVLQPLIVQSDKLPNFTAPAETELAKVLRTGTILQRYGNRTTVRLWSSGDAGIVLSFRR